MKQMTQHGGITAVTLADDTVVLACKEAELTDEDWDAALKAHGVAEAIEPSDWDYLELEGLLVWEIRP